VRVAALYDIHGNLPALDAVLHDVHQQDVDLIVVGGDVLPGPMPQETMSRLLDLDTPTRFIHGNGDRVVLAYTKGESIDEVPAQYRDAISWTASQLDRPAIRALSAWPLTCSVEIDSLGEVLFCHATATNDVDCFTRLTPDSRVARLFEGVLASMVVCGHTHMQFDRTVGTTRFVNAGSIGAPFAPPPAAHWLLLGPDVQLRQTPYDVDAAADQLRATGYPRVEDVAIRYVVNPPSESESLALFAPADART
jgi:predicted phosphodiesterase